MRIYLLNAPFVHNYVRCGRWQGVRAHGKTLWYPIWLGYACGILEEDGNKVQLVDAVAKKWDILQTVEDMSMFRPKFLVVESNFTSISNDLEIVRAFKSRMPETAVAVVGPPASRMAEEILADPAVDFVARREYDFTLRDLVRTLRKGSDIGSVRGLSFKRGNEIIHNPDRDYLNSVDLDTIPFLAKAIKKHLGVSSYFLDHTLHPMIQIFTGRGCPAQCTFCSWPKNMMGHRYRVRSIANVVDELEWIQANLSEVREVFFEDDTFSIDNRRVAAIADEIKRRNLRLIWSCNARATLDYETMRKMRAAGCRLLVVGYESGDDGILKTIKKGLTTERAQRFTHDAKRAGLLILGDFIVGLPGETRKTVEQTRRFILGAVKPDFLQVAVASPIPGTEFFDWACAQGYLLTNDMKQSIDEHGFMRCILRYPSLSESEIEHFAYDLKKEYYVSLRYLWMTLKRIFRKNGWHELRMLWNSARNFARYLLKHRS